MGQRRCERVRSVIDIERVLAREMADSTIATVNRATMRWAG